MRIIENITYVERPSENLALDLYLPYRTPQATVVFAHGGGFQKGTRSSAEVLPLARRFTRDGYAFASISYRLNTPLDAFDIAHRKAIRANRKISVQSGLTTSKRLMGPAFEAARLDLGAAVAFMKSRSSDWDIATSSVFAVGISAGGIAALSLAYPPENLPTTCRPDAVLGLGAAMVQPWCLSPNGVPSLMLHSTMDRIIRPQNTSLIENAARQAEAPLRTIICARRGHGAPVEALLNDKDKTGSPYWTHMRMLFDACSDQSSARKRFIRLDVSQRPPPSF